LSKSTKRMYCKFPFLCTTLLDEPSGWTKEADGLGNNYDTPNTCLATTSTKRSCQITSRPLLDWLVIHLADLLTGSSSLTGGAAKQLGEHLRQLRQTLLGIQDSHCLLHLLHYNSISLLIMTTNTTTMTDCDDDNGYYYSTTNYYSICELVTKVIHPDCT